MTVEIRLLEYEVKWVNRSKMVLLYALCYALAALPAALLLWSLLVPSQRVWPPKHSTFKSMTTAWLVTILAFMSAFALGIIDWNAFGWPLWLRAGLGGGLVLTGNILAFAGMATIGTKATSGGKKALIETGLYRFSRNPQYLGDIMIVAGWFVLSASLLALPAIIILALAAILAPFTEEPWLKGVYGSDYDRYKAKVPRFI